MNKKLQNTIFIIGVIIFSLIAIIYINNNFNIIKTNKANSFSIGIIDGEISKNSLENKDKLFFNDTVKIKKDKITHGDKMLKFAFDYCPNIKIYYYDASNSKGIVDTNGILNGLKWMKKNKLTKINISMSSNVYSGELQELISDNTETFKVYASYNNLIQSLDYPAMYESVTGCGKKNNIPFKNIDIAYSSDKIILFNHNLKPNYYKGNSYLSVLSCLNDII